MQKDSTYLRPNGQKYEYFLSQLVKGEWLQIDHIHQQLKSIGRKPSAAYALMLLRLLESETETTYYKNYYEQLLNLFPGCIVAFYQGNIMVLLQSSEKIQPQNIKSKIDDFLSRNYMQAFLSYTFRDLSLAHIYYQQVKSLQSMLAKSKEPQNFYAYGDHVLEHLLDQCHNAGLKKASIHPDLEELKIYDGNYQTEYLLTLHAYLLCNRNAAQAASMLHLHKSTFFYRLKKLETLFDIDLQNTSLLFAYEYSFRLLEAEKTFSQLPSNERSLGSILTFSPKEHRSGR